MSSNLEAKMNTPTPYAALPGLEPSTTRERCRCGAAIIRTYDDPDVAGIPVTVNREPTTPTAALAAIVNGRTVVYASRFKRDRGAGVGTDFRHWRPAQYAVDFTKPLHVEHVCGETYPPAEPDDTVTRMWPDATTPPPF